MKDCLPVRSVMSPTPRFCSPDDTLRDILRIFATERISCAPICDESNRLIGFLSERHLLGLMHEAASQASDAVMRQLEMPLRTWIPDAPPDCVHPDEPVQDAITRMQALMIRQLPVVDPLSQALVGVVTQSDIIRSQQARLAERADELERQVEARTQALREANAKLEELSLHDALTGLKNRRAMELELDRVFDEATRYGRSFALILIDVDHFKPYNDHYGHLAGDRVLKMSAQELLHRVRRSDQVFRYGGEEFLVLLPESNQLDAQRVAQSLVQCISQLKLPHKKSQLGVITMSAGVSVWQAQHTGWQETMQRADASLYAAKRGGRNQVAI